MNENLLLFYSIWLKKLQFLSLKIRYKDLALNTKHNTMMATSERYSIIFLIVSTIVLIIPFVFWLPAIIFWCCFKIDSPNLTKTDLIKLRNINNAIYLFNQGNYSEALEIFEDISNLISKKDTTFNSWVYQCYLYTHQYEKALDFLQNHHIKNKRIKKLQCYLIRQDFEAMLHTIKKQYLFFEINYNPAILSIICSILLKLNRPTEAKKRLVKYHIDVNNFSEEMCAYLYTLGKCEEALGNMLEAQKAYKTILALNPNFMDINELVKI